MKNILGAFATSAAIVFSISGAFGADLPVAGVSRVYSAACSARFAGLYVGGNIGAAVFRDHSEDRDNWWNDGTGPAVSNTWGLLAKGAAGGVQAGYNRQSPCSGFVYGVETDLQWADLNTTKDYAFGGATLTSKAPWFGTIRTRAGVVVTESSLLYLTAGAAFGKMEWGWSKIFGNPGSFVGDEVKWGYAVGGGVELAHWSPITVKFEVLYLNFVENTISFQSGAHTYRQDHDNEIWVFRVGANYKLGM